ncbi:MAG: 2-amino-4-hydroxy-6-hydroxymethyldihydropteridine diphosphokinase [Tahibacter sp.]
MSTAYVGIGSNLGDSVAIVRAAAQSLDQVPKTHVLRLSALYVTPPWGDIEQPDFINAVAEIDTQLAPRVLLTELLAIEARAGRQRDATRWGPRLLDLDVLLYGNLRVDEDGLQIPHPRLRERAFALLPLADLVPQHNVPGQGRVAEMLARIDTRALRQYGGNTP